MARSAKGAATQSRLRIIGGQWRGRKLTFTPADGLRPTPDRIRETLFNWLAPHIRGALCLDLFAGSGALGLEALSRGARHCDFVDTSGAALAQIGQHLRTLRAEESGNCTPGPARQFLQSASGIYDIVFIDPPFGKAMVDSACALLAEYRLLAADALVYIETGAGEARPRTPDSWQLHREKVAGGVSYRLFVAQGQIV
jgi:16S rRNA (guanine966-N2)-methyltransferase